MYHRTEVINEIDTGTLDSLIAGNIVNSEVLQDNNLLNMESVSYLFLYDNLTTSELSAYFNVTTQTVRNKYSTRLTKSILSSEYSEITGSSVLLYKPEDVFADVYEYETFLRWRSDKRLKTDLFMSVKDAAYIIGCSDTQIRRLIEKKEFMAIPGTELKIFKQSFFFYLKKFYESKLKQLDRIEKFFEKDKNNVHQSGVRQSHVI